MWGRGLNLALRPPTRFAPLCQKGNQTKVFYDKDADLSLIKGKRVTIVGYGSQGPRPRPEPQRNPASTVTVGLRRVAPPGTRPSLPASNVQEVAEPSRRRRRHDPAAGRVPSRMSTRTTSPRTSSKAPPGLCPRLQRALQPDRPACRPGRDHGRPQGPRPHRALRVPEGRRRADPDRRTGTSPARPATSPCPTLLPTAAPRVA